MAQRTAQTKSPINRNLVGGLNVRESVTDVADNEAVQASNVNYYTAGAVVRRGGWKKLIANSPTSNKLMGAFQAVFNNAGTYTYYLVVTDGTDCWTTPDPTLATVVWTKITGAVTLDATNPYRFVMMANTMVMYNGVVAVYWLGSGNLTAFAAASSAYAIQDLTFTLTSAAPAGTTISYTLGGTAGAEQVTVSGNAVTVQIQSGVSTANQIVSAFNNVVAATALATVSVTGTGTNTQTAPAAATLIKTIAVPKSPFGIVWQNFLFWCGDGTNPARLYFSDLGAPTRTPSANFVDIPSLYDGEALTGAAILYGNLILFKRFSIYILQGSPPSNLILSKLNASVGCIDPNSVVQVDNLVYFVSDRGLYAANLFNVRQVSYKVEPRYLSAIPKRSAVNPIWAINYKARSQILVAVNNQALYNATGSNNDRILAHDYFNADKNGDPAVSEFVVGYNVYGLAATKPPAAHPTAPFFMADFVYPTSQTRNPTVISSFYDQWVYVMTEGSLGSGGPADEIAWLPSATFPPTDYLTKFFDFGDPDMIKQVRWVWTTGQNYNAVKLGAGIVYNNSPTAVSFVDYNKDVYVLQAPTGELYQVGVDDDGVWTLTLVTDNTFLTTLVLADANGANWSIGVVTVAGNGVFTTTPSTSSPNTNPIFASPTGYQYQMGVDTDGALTSLQVFSPTTTTITPGSRSAVPAMIGGVAGAKQGKYVQLYFVNISILTQFSMDIILKGRRN